MVLPPCKMMLPPSKMVLPPCKMMLHPSKMVLPPSTADPQSSVSEYLDLASLQNTLTEGPRGFSNVVVVSKVRTEKIEIFLFSQVS